ncbi:hypothetical protein CLV85_1252 [Salinibacterium amurskyense]|uniref:Uncharacterized protein n=1 Tax=Salinibacterium amurskyense TaxID=205941 RepID=A0A2M9D8L0_9MICO|nr:hypothetical protein CLV85_1252 [Salinibacterium amurskyense]RLQ81845.1 hypothetical protein D9C83_06230 [Salinibacterium amurskyense]GHD78316.1 hypothetical protein GCM10007394_05710 [Salinibacterium amurskyense]
MAFGAGGAEALFGSAITVVAYLVIERVYAIGEHKFDYAGLPFGGSGERPAVCRMWRMRSPVTELRAVCIRARRMLLKKARHALHRQYRAIPST